MFKHSVNRVTTQELATDYPGERLWVHLPQSFRGVELWTVMNSDRRWAMHHHTFTASLVLKPRQLRASWHYRGRTQVVSAGEMQLMEPGESHQTTAVSAPASFLVVWWQPHVMQEAALQLGKTGPLHLREWQVSHGRMLNAFTSLQSAVTSGDDPLEVEQWILESTAQLIEHCAEGAPPLRTLSRKHPGAKRAEAYVREHFAENVSLDSLAREAGVSKYHLTRCFAAQFGMPPHRYVKLLRIADAKRRLAMGEPLKDVAAAAGFADQAHLTRSFRATLGVTPSAWANAFRLHRAEFALPGSFAAARS